MPRLLPSAPGVPDPLARQALVDAAIQFCDYTGAVRFSSDPVASVKGLGAYDVDLPQDTEFARVIGVWVGPRQVGLAPEAMVSDVRGVAVQDLPDQGAPAYGVVIEPRALTLVPAPDQDGLPIVIRSTTRPARNAKVLDDALFDRWVEVIVHGALARICRTPNQSFSDPVRAQESETRFISAMGRAKLDANRGAVAGLMRVRNHPFA